MSSNSIDTGTGYSRPDASTNDRLTAVGRGTPMGELLRRYWHPVGLTSYATELPRRVRAFGEDLILFRDKRGHAGLVYDRCCHRGTSLFYGRVEDYGIRCCYHGWKFDAQGHCLEQPSEPVGSTFKDKVRQPWYPVEERYGLIWTYMGPPEKKPLLPRYDILESGAPGETLVADDSNIAAGCATESVPFNWLQHYENILDPAHFFWLHYLHSGPQFGDRFGELNDLAGLRRDLPDIVAAVRFEETTQGVSGNRQARLPDGRLLDTTTEIALPVVRAIPNPFGKAGKCDNVGFILPIDDTHFRIFTVAWYPEGASGRRVLTQDLLNSRPAERMQASPMDWEAQAGQGVVTYHSEEHLGTTDRGVITIRRLFETQMRAVEQGADPLGVCFEPGRETVSFTAGAYLKEAAAAH